METQLLLLMWSLSILSRGIVIAGPTGVGKTNLSINLAKKLDADIISADSAQVYKGLDIGTAKIKVEEMQGVKHYLLDVIEPNKKFNVGEYERIVSDILKDKEKNNKNVLIVGGTGLYIDSITKGLSILPESNKSLREEFKNFSNEVLYNKLFSIDELAARNIHLNNRNKVERALEVCLLTGEKFSIISKQNQKNNNFNWEKIALERNRSNLYERINLRVDLMIKDGLIDETLKLIQKYGESFKNLNIIGYSEIISYIENKLTLEEAIYNIKKNSRHYAKRQFTWFKNDEYTWYNLDNMSENCILSLII